ncbi:helix-turn-helix domain-containing protein [Sphingobacterium sp. B16(2022)]|uniref:helix-turn-helix domain-containing protein n=1 Tax=Sphingobacterium sp. B16(2022) TaxID=2914044 RepID=UPI0019D31A6D|nr:helix-turn-helix domain-containing protein [Sphingobacterium sp. B16(2022)]
MSTKQNIIRKMSTNNDKSLILNQIKIQLGYSKDSEFAKFLGIKPQTLSTWHTRNTFDIELVYAKCEQIDANWLLTGKGQILKNEENQFPSGELNAVKEPVQGYGDDAEFWKNEYIAIQKKYTALLENKLQEIFTADKSSKAG